MNGQLENLILEKLSEYGSMEYEDLLDIVESHYYVDRDTVEKVVFWMYCNGRIEMKKPMHPTLVANTGEITIKEPVTS